MQITESDALFILTWSLCSSCPFARMTDLIMVIKACWHYYGQIYKMSTSERMGEYNFHSKRSIIVKRHHQGLEPPFSSSTNLLGTSWNKRLKLLIYTEIPVCFPLVSPFEKMLLEKNPIKFIKSTYIYISESYLYICIITTDSIDYCKCFIWLTD